LIRAPFFHCGRESFARVSLKRARCSRSQKFCAVNTGISAIVLAAWLMGNCSFAAADDTAALMANRTAIEKVYYDHRLGAKPPFEQALPPTQIERMINLDRKKEAILESVYGEPVSSADLEAEMKRIDASTRAPETLAEIKRALSNDPVRIDRSLIKPIWAERNPGGLGKAIHGTTGIIEKSTPGDHLATHSTVGRGKRGNKPANADRSRGV
jgi:hypothetical protein